MRFAALALVAACSALAQCGGSTRQQPTTSAAAEPDASVAQVDAGDAGADAAPPKEPEQTVAPEEQALMEVVHEVAKRGTAGGKTLRLELVERGPNLPWAIAIVNDTPDSYVVAADPRLLQFEVLPPGKRAKKSTCKLPRGIFPSRAMKNHVTTLGPGQVVVHSFDPRLYCFASGGQNRLVPGAIIEPKFGWPEKTRVKWQAGKRIETPLEYQKPPFVALPASQGVSVSLNEPARETKEGKPNAVKLFKSSALSLGSEYSEWARAGLPPERVEPDPEPLEITATRGSDAHSERTATIAVTLKNRAKRKITVYFRRELLSFEVLGTDGVVTCDAEPDVRTPDRRAYSNLAPGRTLSATSRLIELCPEGTFNQPGLFLVHTRFDANEDGSRFGLEAYTGQVVSSKPASIRIRKTDDPTAGPRPMIRMDLPEPK